MVCSIWSSYIRLECELWKKLCKKIVKKVLTLKLKDDILNKQQVEVEKIKKYFQKSIDIKPQKCYYKKVPFSKKKYFKK